MTAEYTFSFTSYGNLTVKLDEPDEEQAWDIAKEAIESAHITEGVYPITDFTMSEKPDLGLENSEDDGEEEEGESPLVSTITFEYDTSFYGGDYSDSGDNAYVPVALIETLGSEEKAFEFVTGLNQCHIVHWSEEESESYGDGQTEEDMQLQQEAFGNLAMLHAKTCSVCKRSMKEQRLGLVRQHLEEKGTNKR